MADDDLPEWLQETEWDLKDREPIYCSRCKHELGYDLELCPDPACPYLLIELKCGDWASRIDMRARIAKLEIALMVNRACADLRIPHPSYPGASFVCADDGMLLFRIEGARPHDIG